MVASARAARAYFLIDATRFQMRWGGFQFWGHVGLRAEGGAGRARRSAPWQAISEIIREGDEQRSVREAEKTCTRPLRGLAEPHRRLRARGTRPLRGLATGCCAASTDFVVYSAAARPRAYVRCLTSASRTRPLRGLAMYSAAARPRGVLGRCAASGAYSAAARPR